VSAPAGYQPVFIETFGGTRLDPRRWLTHYLPHWSSRARTEPRYELRDGTLILRIDRDQEPWCPEFDPGVRVSSIQTGQFSGPLGSTIGQHRFRHDLVVREEVETTALFVPRYGFFELRAKAEIGARNLVAFWLIGFEDEPQRSGEITIMEIFGDTAGRGQTVLGYGTKPVTDVDLRRDFHQDRLPFDVADWHTYAAEWTATGIAFFLDDRLLRRIETSPAYPMQLMLNLYEWPGHAPPADGQLATFTIEHVSVYQAE
jgi:hypothetical protein